MMNILLTGASGFVGSAVRDELHSQGVHELSLVVRNPVHHLVSENIYVVTSIDDATVWNEIVSGFDVVIHCAGRAHIMDDKVVSPLEEFRKTNVGGTLALARDAAAAGVKRFVFISSVKVNGESTQLGKPFSEKVHSCPTDPYGLSKWEAEKGLHKIGKETGMEVVIIRPVLVYGPGVKANFLSMIQWVKKRIPLPLGGINNMRSYISIENLVDIIIKCIDHPAAANEVFLAADGEDLSTSELLRRIGKALGKPPRLIPVPASMLVLACSLLGKRAVAQRLCGFLQVDISKARNLLEWVPPVTVDQGLCKAVKVSNS